MIRRHPRQGFYPMFQRYFDAGLAQASYLLACERTGDTLFVGPVGRPDLLGEALMRRLAGDLHDSLFRKLLALDDHVEVHPGTGAGSLCGAGIGAEPHSPIGRERRSNPMLKHVDRDEFVAAVLGDLPETPSYFRRMKRMNRDGPSFIGFTDGYQGVPAIDVGAASEKIRDGAAVIDLRDGGAFCAAHPSGAVHMAFGPRIGYWAGWVLPEDTRIVLVAANGREASEAGRQLLRVGFDRIEGYVVGGIDAWRAAGLPISRMPHTTV